MSIQSSVPPKPTFGKRGRVELNGSGSPPPSSGSSFSVPKWALVGVAAMVICAMLATSGGGIGGSGLLGGLLGGMLASKLMQSAKAPSSVPSAGVAGAPAAHATPSTNIARGGFGATGVTSAGAAG
jgi:hypothetical protein